MAIGATKLTSGVSGVTASSYATASVSPAALALILVIVYNNKASGPDTPTLTGAGMTWVQVGTVVEPSNQQRATVFRAMSAAPGSGALTIDYGGANQTRCGWIVISVTGVSGSGTNGSGAVVQSGNVTSDNSPNTTGALVTLAAFGSANNVPIGLLFANGAAGLTEGSGFTSIGNNGDRLWSELGAANDNTVDYTWTSGAVYSILWALELKAAVSSPSSSISASPSPSSSISSSVSASQSPSSSISSSISRSPSSSPSPSSSISSSISASPSPSSSASSSLSASGSVSLSLSASISASPSSSPSESPCPTPVNIVPPHIHGPAKVGFTVCCDVGVWENC